jgi:hypothetical protein
MEKAGFSSRLMLTYENTRRHVSEDKMFIAIAVINTNLTI